MSGPPGPLDGLREQYETQIGQWRERLAYDPATAAVAELGRRVLNAAEAQLREALAAAGRGEINLAEARAEIARLRAELDAYAGGQVYLAMDRDFPRAMAALHAEGVPPGTRLRATDTGRELVASPGGVWLSP